MVVPFGPGWVSGAIPANWLSGTRQVSGVPSLEYTRSARLTTSKHIALPDAQPLIRRGHVELAVCVDPGPGVGLLEVVETRRTQSPRLCR